MRAYRHLQRDTLHPIPIRVLHDIQFRFPPILVLILRIHGSAPNPAPERLRVSLQFQLIMLAQQFLHEIFIAFICNSWCSYWRTRSSSRHNSCSPQFQFEFFIMRAPANEIQFAVHRAGETVPARETIRVSLQI